MVAIDEQSPDISQGVSQALEVRTRRQRRRRPRRAGRRRSGHDVRLRVQRDARAHAAAPSRLRTSSPAGSTTFAGRDPPLPASRRQDPVTVRYEHGKPVELGRIVLASQHAESADLQSIIYRTSRARGRAILPKHLYDPSRLEDITVINATGKFVIGGPMGDCGLTGRKIVVDTYGGAAPHGGGAFSGKDAAQGRPLRRLRRPSRGQERRRRRSGRELPLTGRLRHRFCVTRVGHGRLRRHREVELATIRRSQGAFRPAPGGDTPRPGPAPSHLSEDGRLRPFGRTTAIHLGAHRQGRGRCARPQPQGRRGRAGRRVAAEPGGGLRDSPADRSGGSCPPVTRAAGRTSSPKAGRPCRVSAEAGRLGTTRPWWSLTCMLPSFRCSPPGRSRRPSTTSSPRI